jgi:hypothetical protein
VVSATPRSPYPRERDPLPFLQETGWGPDPVWTGAENVAIPSELARPIKDWIFKIQL